MFPFQRSLVKRYDKVVSGRSEGERLPVDGGRIIRLLEFIRGLGAAAGAGMTTARVARSRFMSCCGESSVVVQGR
jgi:hypothetical protein